MIGFRVSSRATQKLVISPAHKRRGGRSPALPCRRAVQVALAALRLIDAALQAQP